jgi:AcrR family transcriptional regulator
MSPATRPQVREDLLAAARAELAEHGRAAISLRAVARRAGLSHASPKAHFGDRSGLLTAIATEGFHALARSLSEVRESDARHQLAVLGRAYVDFGLSHPALFELMFAPGELHTDDPELAAAQQHSHPGDSRRGEPVGRNRDDAVRRSSEAGPDQLGAGARPRGTGP